MYKRQAIAIAIAIAKAIARLRTGQLIYRVALTDPPNVQHSTLTRTIQFSADWRGSAIYYVCVPGLAGKTARNTYYYIHCVRTYMRQTSAFVPASSY